MNNDIGSRLRAARGIKGWSQEQLASVAQLSTRQIQRIESGDGVPTGETLMALSSALEIDVSELTGFIEEQLDEFRRELPLPTLRIEARREDPIEHEYGVDDMEVFDCGFTRGMKSRPCPAEPRVPKFDDYELTFRQDGERWSCHATGRTEAARQVWLQTGLAKSREQAAKQVERSYIEKRDGYEAAEEFLPFNRFLG